MLQSIRYLIVDERSSAITLERMIREIQPGLEMAGICHSVKEAGKLIHRANPELVILGMEMRDGNGFDLLKMFRDVSFRFIILSASKDYAVEAFRYSATDYLLKPAKPEELAEALKKAVKELTFPGTAMGSIGFHRPVSDSPEQTGSLVIPHAKGFSVVKNEDIILCEAEGYCTSFYLKGNNKISSSRNLKHYGDQLPAGRFMRVHSSFIINLEHVKGYAYNGEITLAENLKCSVSAGHRKEFMGAFGRMK